MDPWQLILILFFTVALCGIYTLLYAILVLLKSLNRHIQWGSPRIQERRPPVTAQHRGD